MSKEEKSASKMKEEAKLALEALEGMWSVKKMYLRYTQKERSDASLVLLPYRLTYSA